MALVLYSGLKNFGSTEIASGKSNTLILKIIGGYNETAPRKFLINYDLKNIHNTDKFGLFIN